MEQIKQRLIELGFIYLDNLWFTKTYGKVDFELNLYYFKDTYGIDLWTDDEHGSAINLKEKLTIEWIEQFDKLFSL